MDQFRHRLLLGASGTGKSTLLKLTAQRIAKQKQLVIVYNPLGNNGWPDTATEAYNTDHLEALVKDERNYGAHVFIDEAIIYRKTFRENLHPTLATLGSVGRHQGMTLWVAGQYATAVDTNIRFNCAECYCFRIVELSHVKDVWGQYGCPSIQGIPAWKVIQTLTVGQYVHFTSKGARFCVVPYKGGG